MMTRNEKSVLAMDTDDEQVSLPPYTDTLDHKSSPDQHLKEQAHEEKEEAHTIWLTFTGASATSVPTTILLTTNSTFLDFQFQIKQRYLESRRVTANRIRIAFIWSTFFVSSNSDDPVDGVCLDEHNWESIKARLLNVPRPETISMKLQKKRLQKPGGGASSSDAGSPRLVVTFYDVNWTERRPAKNPEMLERQQKAHQNNERAFLLQGKHLPPPRMSTCVVM